MRLQTRITILVCAVVAMALLVTDLIISQRIAENTRNQIEQKATDIGHIVAHSPLVIDALSGKADESLIQSYAAEIQGITDVEFIVVMDMEGTRKSHPDPEKVGQPFVGGDEKEALKGNEYISTAAGTLGPSLRFFTPIYSEDGTQVGAVSVGLLLNDVRNAVSQSKEVIYVCIVLGLVLGVIGAMLLSENVKRTLFGLEPHSIAKLLEERNAMLESVREGILAVDRDHKVTLVNAEAGKLFSRAGIKGNPIGKKVEDTIPNTGMTHVLESGNAELDQEQDLNGIVLLTNRIPVRVNGEVVGVIATFRDKTEIKLLAEQLTGVKLYAEALRAQTHEFMNKLHVILGMVQLKSFDELASYISRIKSSYQEEVGFVLRHIKDPVVAGFIIGKISNAREENIEINLDAEAYLPESRDGETSHKVVTILGNLIDNSMEAVEASDSKVVDVDFQHEAGWLSMEVSDSGKGIPIEVRRHIFEKGYSTKGDGRGIGLHLVKQSIESMGGEIELFSKPGEGTQVLLRIPYVSKEDSL
jgi:CitB family two-component system sensor histidine kinase MalK